MATARRWQIASLATAVAGLGLGGLLLGRSPSVEVDPIDLDAVTASSTSDDPAFRLPPPGPPEIVVPRVREEHLGPAEDRRDAHRPTGNTTNWSRWITSRTYPGPSDSAATAVERPASRTTSATS